MSGAGIAVREPARHDHDLAGVPSSGVWSRYPELAAVRSAVRSRDWDATAAELAVLRPQHLSLALELVADEDGVEGMLERAVDAAPGDPLASTFLARRYASIGWGVRTGARAADVPAAQLAEFRTWLVRAEQLLVEVCADHPEHVPAWETRLLTARGLELGLSEARRRYDRLAALSPHHHRAQRAFLLQLVPRWGGSWEAAEAFVAECATGAPEGAASRGLAASLMVERWLELGEVPRDDAGLERLRRTARESVLHADHVPGPDGDTVHAELALLLTFVERHRDAAPHFTVLGDEPVPSGWEYLDHGDEWYARSRAQALGGPVPPPPDLLPAGQRRGLQRVAVALVLLGLLAFGALLVLSLRAAVAGEPDAVLAAILFAAGTAGLVGCLVWLVRPSRARRRS